MLSSMLGQFLETFPEAQMSLQRFGQEEAQRFKWIQSEKEGRDLGDHAIKLWVLQHWNGFLRQRWIEHLQGKTCWIELQKEDFGLLQRRFRTSPLINRKAALSSPCETRYSSIARSSLRYCSDEPRFTLNSGGCAM